jgi:hypothetical protein
MFYYASPVELIALCHSIPLSKAMWHSLVSPLQTGLSPAHTSKKRSLPLLERFATTPRVSANSAARHDHTNRSRAHLLNGVLSCLVANEGNPGRHRRLSSCGLNGVSSLQALTRSCA